MNKNAIVIRFGDIKPLLVKLAQYQNRSQSSCIVNLVVEKCREIGITIDQEEPKVIKNKEIKTKEYTEDFLQFWSLYPLKKSKNEAFKSWRKLKVDSRLLNRITFAIDDQIRERELILSNGGWCPEWKHPATWLNQKSWEDEINTKIETQKKLSLADKANIKAREYLNELY